VLLPIPSGVKASALALLAAATLALAGCGGSGGKKSYTYTFAAGGRSPLNRGIYFSVTSPIPIPPSAFKGGRPVDHVAAPRACTITQTVTKPPPKYPQFKGKTLTLTVYGSTPIVQLICQLARQSLTQAFDR
jgi:hypothetical protein